MGADGLLRPPEPVLARHDRRRRIPLHSRTPHEAPLDEPDGEEYNLLRKLVNAGFGRATTYKLKHGGLACPPTGGQAQSAAEIRRLRSERKLESCSVLWMHLNERASVIAVASFFFLGKYKFLGEVVL